MKKLTLLDTLALFTTLTILLGVAGLSWSSMKSLDDLGPRLLAKDQHEQVYLIVGGRLLVLEPGGALLKNVALADLGLSGDSTDMAVLSDGTVWIADYAEGNIFSCDLAGMSCRPLLHSYGNKRRLFPGTFHFAADEQRRRIYVTNTLLHRLEEFSWEGRFIRAVRVRDEEYGEICYPNGVRLLQDGALVITDTNQHRLVIVNVGKNDFGGAQRSIPVARGKARTVHCKPYPYEQTGGRGDNWVPTRDEFKQQAATLQAPLHGRSRYYWPIDTALDEQQHWWVINTNADLSIADIIVFDNKGEALQRVELPEEYPAIYDILALKDKVLIPDNRFMRIYAVSFSGEVLEDFGDEALQEILRDFLKAYSVYTLVKYASYLLIALGVILAGVVLTIRISSARTA